MATMKEYEMSDDDLKDLLDNCKPVVAIALQCGERATPQEKANRWWKALGERLGFDHMTVRPIFGKSERFFTAVPK